jgi:cytochrome c peroxidase
LAFLLLGTWCAASDPDAPRLPKDTLPASPPLDAVPLGLVSAPQSTPENPVTAGKVALGRKLFFDPLLSVDRTISCATCHDPRHGMAASEPAALGVMGRRGRRNAPTVFNTALGRTFFWDGRATSLEEQALKPIENPTELGSGVDEVLRRLRDDADYDARFAAEFADGVTAVNLARAIASFERSLLAGDTRVDRFLAAQDRTLTTAERQGLWLFDSRGRCWMCHAGPNFSDGKFHNTGVSWGKEPLDLGRFEVTQHDADRGRFKTPTLRGVAHTAPYMHDGSIKTLREVIEFYNRGGGRNPNLDHAVQTLSLSTQDVDNLIAFLEALSEPATEPPKGRPDDRPNHEPHER